MAPGCTMGRRRAGGGGVMLWAMFCWESLGPAIHVDVTLTRSTYLFADQEWFDEHNNQFEVLTWPPNSPDLNPVQHLWDVLDKQVPTMETPPHNLQDLKDLLLTSWCQIPQHTFRDLVESMPRRVRAVLAAKRETDNIRQVVIMLCLSGVYVV
ncbi:hypothetical protein QTP86_029169 [Hemibagrus guttatus]|nr:hypothetical protein QTP86_029169 [Hemibagrus guttatus]